MLPNYRFHQRMAPRAAQSLHVEEQFHAYRKRHSHFSSLPDLWQGNEVNRSRSNLRKRYLRFFVQ